MQVFGGLYNHRALHSAVFFYHHLRRQLFRVSGDGLNGYNMWASGGALRVHGDSALMIMEVTALSYRAVFPRTERQDCEL